MTTTPSPGGATRVHLPHPEILRAFAPGHVVLIDDGRVRLHVVEATPTCARAIVDVPGRVSNRKGVSLPDTEVPVSAMTPKDHSDLDAALAEGVDWIAVSFVQRPDDIAEVKKIARGRAAVLAKIEKPQAIARLDEIMEVSDALMVARGDLGVEMPLERVPGLQKRITRNARRYGKPVVVATQMLESMISAPVPTRAEVSDVATAVFRGRRRRHAVGRERGRAIPGRSGGHHEPHRRGGGARSDLSQRDRRAAQRARGDRRRRHRGRRARHRRDARREGGVRLDVVGLNGAAARARAAGPARAGADPPTATRRGGCRSCGACTPWRPRTRATSTT